MKLLITKSVSQKVVFAGISAWIVRGSASVSNGMSTQALNTDAVRTSMKDILVNKAGLYEALREQVASE